MEKNHIYLPGYVKKSFPFGTLSKSLLYGLIITKKVTYVNKRFHIFHAQNDFLSSPSCVQFCDVPLPYSK